MLEIAPTEQVWQRNYASVADKMLEVLADQSKRCQVIVFSEADARRTYPNLVAASLGAIMKDKPGGIVSARVLFDGTNDISVKRRTRIMDQERAPTAADLKRFMPQKARQGEKTLAPTADVAEAHRQIRIHPRDWHLLGCQVQAGGDVYVKAVGASAS